MRHLIHFTDGHIQPLWAPGTPFRERFRLARAFRAFAEGLDPRDREGFFRFDVDDDGNALVGGRERPTPGMVPNRLLDTLVAELQRPRYIERLLPPVSVSVGDRVRLLTEAEAELPREIVGYYGMTGSVAGFDSDADPFRVFVRIDGGGPVLALPLWMIVSAR